MNTQTPALAIRSCPVCGKTNNDVTMRLNGPTEWEDCGHSTVDLLARAMLPVTERWPTAADVARRALA